MSAYTDAEHARYPHVYPWQWPVLDEYRDRLANTGGNDPADLLNQLQNPGTDDRPNRLATINLPVFCLAVGVQSQVMLLREEAHRIRATGAPAQAVRELWSLVKSAGNLDDDESLARVARPLVEEEWVRLGYVRAMRQVVEILERLAP